MSFSLALSYPTAAEAQRVFDILTESGKVDMPLQKTFWAEAFGVLVELGSGSQESLRSRDLIVAKETRSPQDEVQDTSPPVFLDMLAPALAWS